MERLKLLIIEDDVDQRDLIRETLEDHFGAGTVVGVDSKRAALDQDLASFDLILSDYNLTDGTGMELLSEIQKRCTTPVIMVTGENVGHIAAEAIQRGATDYVVKVGDYLFTIPLVVQKNLQVAKVKRENESLRLELEQTLDALKEKNLLLEESLKKVEEVAATDPLTGLYNRRHFGRVFEQLFSEAQRYTQNLSCVMIDLDGYKQLNDKHGHQVGDQILVVVGKVIGANMRKMDVAARYGGDEFILLLPHASAEEAAGVADRIRAEYKQGGTTLFQKTLPNEVIPPLTMSIGIAALRDVPQSIPSYADQLIARADASLYRSKKDGRNRITLHAAMPAVTAA
ncbi:GGDEF domain-containing response regulator [Humisphaera borealis]|uniref:diguanylate cyclase n=1 Tax=Humisphaera borealis TaxID=2807512 RepID=A0A7M2X118_9BACT|nr:GGDEF domain-containing response regulator [Humisphaera borealis]QOV90811.1 GGDEF domain-containing response regulator [Humisphaera borealis]